MLRGLATLVAAGALALIGCRHPTPCIPARMKEVAASIPPCAAAPAGVLDASRIKEVALGSPVSVRGLLTMGRIGCTMMACETVDGTTGRQRAARCCNGCDAAWNLVGTSAASATPVTSGATEIFLRRAGAETEDVLSYGALDCLIGAMAAAPRIEIIATGRLRTAEPDFGPRTWAPDALAIDDVTLCATGRWGPPDPAAHRADTECR